MEDGDVQHSQKFDILHPKSSPKPLGLLAEVKSAVLHGGGLVHEKRDAVASVQNLLYVVNHDSVYLQMCQSTSMAKLSTLRS